MRRMGRTYDDARDHREHLPGDLPRKAGATHLGLFFAWCAMRGLASDWHGRLDPDRIERLKRRELTGRDYVVDYLDGKLEADHLTPEGQVFAERFVATGQYFEAYTRALAEGLPSPYHVEDTWEHFEALAPILDRAYAEITGGSVEPAPVVVELGDVEVEVELGEVEVQVDAEDVDLVEAEPEPVPERAPEPEPAPSERPDLGIPHRDEAFAPYEEVLSSSGGPHGGPVIETEPDDGSPPPVEVDDSEPTWTWEQTVRGHVREAEERPAVRTEPPAPREQAAPDPRMRTVPPPLQDELKKRLAIKVGRQKGKGGGWIWVGLVIFLLLYGCGKAASRTARYEPEAPTWDDSWGN